LSSATYEDDLEKPIIISTAQTFLSLLKRNRKQFLIKLNEANIGIFVGDEVHTTVGAPTFSECSIHIPSKYTYGLSATPYRFDGNGDIIEYHLGEVFSDEDSQGTMDAKVTVFLLDYEIDTPHRAQYVRWGGDFQRARYLNLMKKSKPFISLLRGLLGKLKDRNLICVAERIKLIDELHKWMPSKSKAKFCGQGGLDTLNAQHTFATPGKCRDGVDAPWKDAIIMTSPISNIEQLAGRVTRTDTNKKNPIVIDMVDYGCHDISRTYFKRLEYYGKKGWNIQYILYKNGKLAPIDGALALSIIRGEEL
jgi:superfamily II DNA or RNA helicase